MKKSENRIPKVFKYDDTARDVFKVFDVRLAMRLYKELSTYSNMRKNLKRKEFTDVMCYFSDESYKRKNIHVLNLLKENC